MSYVQEPPFAIQVELVEGCNLFCSFCGINGIRSKVGNYKFMTQQTASRLAHRILEAKWNCRIEIAMHGEPTANPDWINMVGIFRTILPKHQLMMTTNGLLLTPENIPEAFENGLNILAIDNYGNTDKYDWIKELGLTVYNYPQEPDGNPHRRQKKGVSFISLVQDIAGASKGTHSSMNNHCGSGAPLNDKAQGKRCAKPFREISVRWDGSVASCCNDFRGLINCGSIHTMTLMDIWTSARFEAVRKYVYNGLRTIPPCKGCDATSYRVGCLPDKLGKHSYPLPTQEDEDLLIEALYDRPLATINKRPWED